MLYISGFVGAAKYSVMDTDDGVEQTVTHKELRDLVVDLGIDIKGVTKCAIDDHASTRQSYVGISVDVWQGATNSSADLLKLKMLRGVDLRVRDDMIIGLVLDKKLLRGDTTIRLSDYASRCGDYILKNMPYDSGQLVTLIVDDKIKLSNRALKRFTLCGVCVDLRETTDKKVSEWVCSELVQAVSGLEKIEYYVSDRPERLDYYTGMLLLNRTQNIHPEIGHVSEVVRDAARVNKIISAKYKREFENISKAEYSVSRGLPVTKFARKFIAWLSENSRYLDQDDYELLRRSQVSSLFSVMREISTLNKSALLRFKNYVQFFDATPEIRDAYVKFCNRAGYWILDYGKSSGMIR